MSLRFSKSEVPIQDGEKRAALKDATSEILLDVPNRDQNYDVLIIGVGSMA